MLALLPIAAFAATFVDMQQNFNGLGRASFSSTSTSQNGHTGAWISGYPSDPWAAETAYGADCLRPLTDDNGGTWGGTGEPVDNHLTYAGREWRDLQIDVKIRQNNNNVDEDTVGVVFRWTDSSNFYLAFTTRSSTPGTGTGTGIITIGTFVYRVTGGVATQILSSPTFHAAGWSAFRVRAVGAQIDVAIDANADGDFADAGETFGVTDSSPITTIGRIGLYEFDDAFDGAAFDDLIVTIDDADPDGDGIPDARDNCVGYANGKQGDVDGDRIGDTCEDDDFDGQSEQQGDCNDTNNAIYKSAPESCDATDSDCDGDLVDGATDTDTDKAPDCVDTDDDADGVADAADCKSLDKTVFPGAPESCDAIDSNCNASLVDTFANFDTDLEPDCIDLDDDDDADPDLADCDDVNATIFTDAAETCDLIDQDCDSDVVEAFSDVDTDKKPDCADDDDDNDSSIDTADCAPLDKTAYPGAPEVCDLVDQDCDGNLVEGFKNTDGDGQADCVDDDDDGDGAADKADCGPLDKAVYPGAPESSCDNVDSDCDGDFTDGVGLDFDKDGLSDCADDDDDNDAALDAADCDDFNNKVYPGAAEGCDAVDSNCNGSMVDQYVDSDADKMPDCADADDDGDGSVDSADCAPLNKAVFPGAIEVCDLIDSNCNKSLVDAFPDSDLDKTPNCTDTDDDSDGVADTGDCAPLNAAIYPGRSELCDTIDSDCDLSLVDDFADFDRDKSPDCVDADDDNDGVTDKTDCQPTNAAVSPTAVELCNSIDDDCSGTVDDSYAKNAPAWYRDADKDGRGDPSAVLAGCKQPPGYVASRDDCNDSVAAIHGGAKETCSTLFDDDCDGGANDADPNGPPADAGRWHADADSDLFGDPVNIEVSCIQPDGWTDGFSATDCDDTNSEVNPSATELCNNDVDDDCDGVTDDDADQQEWWPDADKDGYGDAAAGSSVDCEPPGTGWVMVGEDCDDSDAEVNPASIEVTGNGLDDDCDANTPDGSEDTGGDDTDPEDTDVEPDTDAPDDTGGRPIVDTADSEVETDTPADSGVDEGTGPCGCGQSAGGPSSLLVAVAAWALRSRRRR